MRVVFLSNYFNHHQSALSEELFRLTGGDYRFIATSDMRQERKNLGYSQETPPAYVIRSHKSESERMEAEQWIRSADLVIVGSAPEGMMRQRIREGKLIFRYSERPLKNGMQPMRYLPRLIRWHKQTPFWKPVYLLAASAYAAADYHKFGLFRKKSYRWGYFPAVKEYTDRAKLLDQKTENKLLWCGRMIDWKHPDDVVRLAKRLKDENISFSLDMIGTGTMEKQLQTMICENGLENYVRILGSMKPEEVRLHMERADIFLFTSDRKEGWGAVLNEAMNSGCAVIASHAAGAAPFLIRDGENGLIYRSGDQDMLYSKTKLLLQDLRLRRELGKNAMDTIGQVWNAGIAAKRVIQLAGCILKGEKHPNLFGEGPCSRAESLKDNWI